MAKPSIFSRDYEKIMRKRKKRRNIIVLLGVLTLTVSIIIIKYNMQKISAAFKDIAFSKELKLNNFKTENIKLPIDDYILTLKVISNNDNLEIVDVKCDNQLISADINKDEVLIIDNNQKKYSINLIVDTSSLLDAYINIVSLQITFLLLITLLKIILSFKSLLIIFALKYL